MIRYFVGLSAFNTLKSERNLLVLNGTINIFICRHNVNRETLRAHTIKVMNTTAKTYIYHECALCVLH